MEWAASSSELVIQRIPREQKVNDVIIADAGTGKATTVLSETDECWVNASDNLRWVGGGTHFTWLSERSGFTHLYLVSRDGTHSHCLVLPSAHRSHFENAKRMSMLVLTTVSAMARQAARRPDRPARPG